MDDLEDWPYDPKNEQRIVQSFSPDREQIKESRRFRIYVEFTKLDPLYARQLIDEFKELTCRPQSYATLGDRLESLGREIFIEMAEEAIRNAMN
jgi:hypothetical protein